MTAGLRGWLLSVIAVSILCAAADALMPPGGPKRVGKLVCGLVLLCAVLSPLRELDIESGVRWVEDWQASLEAREGELSAQADEVRRAVIEQEYAAYIVDKAAGLGLPEVSARVTCREENGLLLPDRAEVTGPLGGEGRETLARAIREDLGIPPENQIYHEGEETP